MDATGPQDTIAGTSPSRLEQALSSLLAASPGMPPEELAGATRTAVGLMGGRDTELLLVDLAQRQLVPLQQRDRVAGGDGYGGGDAGDSNAQPHPVDGPGAGEAYRTERQVAEPDGESTRLWVPILDSAERVGVLGTTVDALAPDDEARWALLAGLLGELVVTKSRYGDRVVTTRRTAPVRVAAELRWALLPPLTFSSPDVIVTGILEPAHRVAGDTFDYSVTRDAVTVALFDAMGHGLAAGRMADLVVGVHRNRRRAGASLADGVAALDRAVAAEFGESQFVTAQVGRLDLASGHLSLVNAGHPDAVVFHPDGSYEMLPIARCRPLGLGTDATRSVEVQLGEGDVVLLHTDGVEDARSPTGGFFGPERLYELVARLLREQVRLPEVLRLVVRDVLDHSVELADDATAMLVGWRTGRHAIPPSIRPAVEGDGPSR